MEENNKESLSNEFVSSSNIMLVKRPFKSSSQSDEKEFSESFLRSANIYAAITKGFWQLICWRDDEFFENPEQKDRFRWFLYEMVHSNGYFSVDLGKL